MIHLKFLGHIRTSMGAEERDIPQDGISVDDLFDILLSNKPAELDHGFTKYNTLVVINGEEAVSPAAHKDRRLSDGDSVLLVPFSHGG
ncbi:MAG TPA: MoaD/ThiS family protein [Nitrososphaerales archaeon]|nr:MoaD/ThiS family protein [Nitrososphaerales archaeon]